MKHDKTAACQQGKVEKMVTPKYADPLMCWTHFKVDTESVFHSVHKSNIHVYITTHFNYFFSTSDLFIRPQKILRRYYVMGLSASAVHRSGGFCALT